MHTAIKVWHQKRPEMNNWSLPLRASLTKSRRRHAAGIGSLSLIFGVICLLGLPLALANVSIAPENPSDQVNGTALFQNNSASSENESPLASPAPGEEDLVETGPIPNETEPLTETSDAIPGQEDSAVDNDGKSPTENSTAFVGENDSLSENSNAAEGNSTTTENSDLNEDNGGLEDSNTASVGDGSAVTENSTELEENDLVATNNGTGASENATVLPNDEPIQDDTNSAAYEVSAEGGAVDSNAAQDSGFVASPASVADESLELVRTVPNIKRCNFSGTITMSNFVSMGYEDKFFRLSQLLKTAAEMVVDHVNFKRCGVRLNGGNYSLTLKTYGDSSSVKKTQDIGRAIVNKTDFMIAGFTSLLTGALAPVAEESGRLLMTGAGLTPSVYKGRDWVFGVLPPGPDLLRETIRGLAKQGATSIAHMQEQGLKCFNVPELADAFGLEYTSGQEVESSPTMDVLYPLALKIKEEDPDIMVTCAFQLTCADWIRAMRNSGWSPRAQVFTLCVGTTDFEVAVGENDLEYMMGATPWHKSIPREDIITGWSAKDFARRFEDISNHNISFHAAATASGVGLLVQAIEGANSLDQELVRRELVNNHFPTVFGNVTFDPNGQNEAPALLIQYDASGSAQSVYPAELRSKELAYPMPTWGYRDCTKLSQCIASGGECLDDGDCLCTDDDAVSLGSGANATCKIIPVEDLTLFSPALVIVGIVMVSVQGFISAFAILWTILLRHKRIVRASQPIFLTLVAVGCFVIVSSIIPMGRQAGYRYNKDPETGSLTDEPNKNAFSADGACMAEPWVFWVGFGVTFSALFAKIWRVKLIFMGRGFVKKTVTPKDVAVIMVAVVLIEVAILLTWQLTAPFTWERSILVTDSDGFTLKSVGTCTSQGGWWFVIALALFHLFFLLYALYICYITRKIPSEFAEGKWVAAAIVTMFQILLLALPTLMMVIDDTNAFYFVRACGKFLTSTTVTTFIFAPKMYNCHIKKDTSSGMAAVRRGMRRPDIDACRLAAREVPASSIQIGDSIALPAERSSMTYRGSNRTSNSSVGVGVGKTVETVPAKDSTEESE